MTSSFHFPNVSYDPTACDRLDSIWVDDETTLANLINDISTLDIVALDTEFIRRTTYYPILALIQINTGKAIYLIDAPKLNLEPLWQALIRLPLMVWYACSEDLTIFYHLTGCPPLTNVFDVQIGVAYLTDKTHVGYAQALSAILGVTLDKSESQSNWLARPLSPEQIHYAGDDVRYLLDLYVIIKQSLTRHQLTTCVIEDSLTHAQEIHTALYTPHDLLYLDSIDPSYDQRQITALRHLMAWREDLAKTTNQPKSFIIGKQALREIITDMPTNLKQLAQTTLNRHALRQYGHDIIHIIKHTKQLPEHALTDMPPPTYNSKDKPFKKALTHAINEYSQAHHIPPSLLMRGRWINQLLYMVHQELDATHLPQGLTGYRQTWVVETILPLLRQYKTQIDAGFLS